MTPSIEPSDAPSEEVAEEEVAEEEVAEEEVVEEEVEHHRQSHHKPSNQYRAPQMYEPWENSQQTSMETEPKEKTSLKSAKDISCLTKTYQDSIPLRRRFNLC
jgi:hypothetical protein